MPACRRCEERGQTWEGSQPECAFEKGVFSNDNWQCATMNALRENLEKTADRISWSDDQNCGTLIGVGRFLILGWYKSRGRTEACVLLDELNVSSAPSLADVEAFLP